jgi:hypothetical protein
MVHFCWLLFYGCQTTGDSYKKSSPDSIINKNVSKPQSGKQDPLWSGGYYIKKPTEGLVPIDSIGNGYDSIQIRVWQVQGLFGHRQLYAFKNDGKRWTGYFYELMIDSNFGNGRGSREFLRGPIPFDLTKFKKLNPKIGWQQFIDSLIILKILDLPDFTKDLGMQTIHSDTSPIIIEIATKHNYRYYTYFDVDFFSDKFWQAKNMFKILMLIYNQFGHIPSFA